MKLKRESIGVMIFAIILSLFTGCAMNKEPTRQQQAVPVEVTMWVHQQFENEAEFYERRIKQFNEAYEGRIHVTLIPLERFQYEEQVKAATYTGQLPDIILVDSPDVPAYAEEGTIVPMNEYVSEEFLSDFLPSTIQQGTYKNQFYQLAGQESSVVLYYNIRMLKQAGINPPTTIEEAWTWDQLLENAIKLTKSRVYGLNMYYNYNDTEWFTYAFLPFVWSNGGEIVGPDGYTVEGYLNGPKTVEAFDFIGKIFRAGVTNTSIRNTDFQEGNAAMAFNGAGYINILKEESPNLEWGMIPYSVSPNTRTQVTPSGNWGYSITSNSKHPEEAFEVINWMTNQQSNLDIYNITGNPPARKSVYNEIPQYQQLPEKIAADQLFTTARVRPRTPIYPILSENFAKAFKAVVSGKEAQKTLDEAVISAQREIEQYKKIHEKK